MTLFASLSLFCLLTSAIWECLELNVVDKYTFEFKNKVLTTVMKKSKKTVIQDPRERTMNMFVKFFMSYKHSQLYFAKYIIVSMINLTLHICIYLLLANMLFDTLTDTLEPTNFYKLAKLSLTDDLNQERLDTLAILFPSLYGCIIPVNGLSGSIYNITVTCASNSNPKSAILHVAALFFSILMIVSYLIDTMVVILSIAIYPWLRSKGNIVNFANYKSLDCGQIMLLLLFEKNTEALFWIDFLKAFNQNFKSSKKSEKSKEDKEQRSFEHLEV